MLGAAIANNLKKYLSFIVKKTNAKPVALTAAAFNDNNGIKSRFFFVLSHYFLKTEFFPNEKFRFLIKKINSEKIGIQY